MERSDVNHQSEFIPRLGTKDFEEIRLPFRTRKMSPQFTERRARSKLSGRINSERTKKILKKFSRVLRSEIMRGA